MRLCLIHPYAEHYTYCNKYVGNLEWYRCSGTTIHVYRAYFYDEWIKRQSTVISLKTYLILVLAKGSQFR
jgi:hypothetical protein